MVANGGLGVAVGILLKLPLWGEFTLKLGKRYWGDLVHGFSVSTCKPPTLTLSTFTVVCIFCPWVTGV